MAIYIFLPEQYTLLSVVWLFSALVFSILWTTLKTIQKKSPSYSFWGFLIGRNLLMATLILYWFFDLEGSRTGGSTSALIFAVMPFWAFIFGSIGNVIAARMKKHNQA
ncbi:hypothetical protein MED297_21097 [Reinekea sp. MED297]|uniref:Uncharacterized protein n=1 Tax=Reinekea blandensis MED297 TaxID=314283 RepID=A4B9X4_9GAMM|nr:hypothetical protein MED297_21097 [Reinekea sp. MED297] [Reinekea blandensis MED297]